ncbi:MAG TPA: nucleotidyl transferase AbiEii/AbiGii toxin family protein [Verrucomicrobiae bacterium]|nr:nucleotidyl transferase AbiEii/AbiGii toxin family protein [Verrucomicrobiae bacterium]
MLPQETEGVWHFLREQPALAGFILIGGTALALRLKHRRSEDLDLAFLEFRLPKARLEALRHAAAQAGFDFQPDDDEAAVQEFALGGMELHDYQEDFIINSAVRVSFFVADAPLTKVLAGAPENRVRLATLPELFKSKCLVSALRSKTRDWLDLYLLLREYGFSIRDFRQAFREAGVEEQCDIALSRLCTGVPQRDDEGYAHLLENPPSLEEMKKFFIEQRNLLEIQCAEEARRIKKEAENHGND